MVNITKIVNERLKKLNNSKCTFKDIFEIIHSSENDIFCEKTNGYKIETFTYSDCKMQSIKCAVFFVNNLKNVPKGSFVGLMMDSSMLWITSFWGLLMAGYKPMLINLRLTDVLNNEIISMLKISTIITDQNHSVNANQLIISQGQIDSIKITGNETFNWENELALSTSATSLNVKVCVYDSYAIAEQIRDTKSILKENSMIKKHYHNSLKVLVFLPFYHIFGLVAMYFWFAFFGRTFVFLRDYSSDTILRTVQKHNVTHIFGVPLLWHTIYKGIITQVNSMDDKTKNKFYKGIELSIKLQTISPHLGKSVASILFKDVQSKLFGKSINFMITGGGYINHETLKVLNGIGYPLYNGYGMSEIGITSVELREKAKYRIEGSIGKPFDSVGYSSKDNCLQVKSKSMCNRIYSPEEAIIIDNNSWFNTNDLCTIADKNYCFIHGRKDDVIIATNGEKINPDLIEKNLYFSHCKKYSILGIEGKICLIVEISKFTNNFQANKIINEINENIAKLQSLNYTINDIYYTYDEISPKQAIKENRGLLKKWIDSGKVTLHPYNELKTKEYNTKEDLEDEVSQRIKTIFAKILNIDPSTIKNSDNFILDLGGTSLDYFTLLNTIKEEFYIDTNIQICYTVDDFIKLIDK